VPDRSRDALLIVDMLSDFGFRGGLQACRAALPVARRIAALKRRAATAGVPVIYVNDGHGRWRSDLTALLNHARRPGSRGAAIARLLQPEAVDYCVLKPKHSGFYATALGTLLEYLGSRRLVLTGSSAYQCVLFTANDAYVRDFQLRIPRDCVASDDPGARRLALRYFREVLGANTSPSGRIRFWRTRRRRRG
jgi:nicotinamidase-related amidase